MSKKADPATCVRLRASGLSLREIGRRLGVDHKTVGKALESAPALPQGASLGQAGAASPDERSGLVAYVATLESIIGDASTHKRDRIGAIAEARRVRERISAIDALAATEAATQLEDVDGQWVREKLQRVAANRAAAIEAALVGLPADAADRIRAAALGGSWRGHKGTPHSLAGQLADTMVDPPMEGANGTEG